MGILDDESTFWRRGDLTTTYRIPTKHVCPACKDDIEADDDVAMLTVVQGQLVGRKIECYPFLDDKGDFMFSPQFMHMKGCWGDLYDELERTSAGKVADRTSTFHCESCGSGIRDWEVMVFAEYGEFHTSKRNPNNKDSGYLFQRFKDSEDPTSVICLACIMNAVGSELSAWEDLSENGECSYCTQARCWRVAQCGCDCHEKGEENG